MILLIDNYDSFVYNLARYTEEVGLNSLVCRNDAITLADIKCLSPSHIIISPGPCTPLEAGLSNAIIKEYAKKIPILGVCLGHQAIGYVFGGKVIRALAPMHGKSSVIKHENHFLFKDIPQKWTVGRYHSLVVERQSLPSCLQIIAESEAGEIMALAHMAYPVFGVQFHPESVMTEYGHTLLRNFYSVTGGN